MFEEQLPENKNYYPFLDGFRGLAVLWVILHHANSHLNWELLPEIPFQTFKKLAYVGFLGVDVFFVISGFLITGLLIEDFNKGKIRLKRFYLRRAFKIIPQYFFILFIGLGLTASIPVYRAELHNTFWILSQFVFLQNYCSALTILAHTWSLAIEEHFYLFYPLALKAICKFFPRPETRYKILLSVCLALILAFNALRRFSVGPDFLSRFFHVTQYFHTTFYRADSLVMGCLFKLLEPYYQNKKTFLWKIFTYFCFDAVS